MRLDPARTLLRFWLGAAGGVLAGFLPFGRAVFLPNQPEFQCVTVGALCAGMLVLVRGRRHAEALALAVAYGCLLLGLSSGNRWRASAAGLLLALGILVTARIFDELAQYGLRFGKFLLLGPLLGGVFLALTPLTEFQTLAPERIDAFVPLMRQLFLGVVIGDGVGLGVEVAEFMWPVRPPHAVRSGPAETATARSTPPAGPAWQ